MIREDDDHFAARGPSSLVIRAGPSVTSWRPYRHGAVKPIAPRPCLDSGGPGAQPAPARAPRPGCGAETGVSRAAFRSRSGYGATDRPGSLRGKRKATRGARGLGRSAGRWFESTRRHQIPMRSGKLPRGTLRKSASTLTDVGLGFRRADAGTSTRDVANSCSRSPAPWKSDTSQP